MNRVVRLLCKLIQRQTYSCLSTRYGTILCLGGLLITLISLLQFGELLIEWSMERYSTQFSIFRDNIGKKSYQDRLCLPVPIDIVYTWVNGTDPKLIRELRKLKTELDNGSGRNPKNGTLLENKSSVRVDPDIKCMYNNCVKARIAVVLHDKLPLSLKGIQSLHPAYRSVSRVLNYTINSEPNRRVLLLYFPSHESVHNAVLEKVHFQHEKIDGFLGYFTTNNSLPNSISSENELIITGFRRYTDLSSLHKVLQKRFHKAICDITYDPNVHIAIVYFADKLSASSALRLFGGNYLLDTGTVLKVLKAYLTWTFSWSYIKKVPESIDSAEDHVISANRFADNQELKYSLRSVQTFSPWIRNVYIVTNGQIPSWLNLDNPRVKIVTHQDIFLNKSHLPTFSSPAIESHLHRIPGLSKKFIYMNDDVMFGDYVWPDDFYTHSKGQKIFLTWAVPNCNEGCPASWIKDKYCDKACNVSECDYDGGDCIGIKKDTRYAYQTWHSQQSKFRLDFCSTGCADSWVGDRYCDASCNVYACGFDAGDCGIVQFDKLYQVDIIQQINNYYLPHGLSVLFCNLTSIFGKSKITEVEYGDNKVIRTAILAQKHKLLSLTLRQNYTTTTIGLRIKGMINETKSITKTFNVTVTTTGEFKPTIEVPSLTIENQTKPKTDSESLDFMSIKEIYVNQSTTSFRERDWSKLDQIYNILEMSNKTMVRLPDEIKDDIRRLDMELKGGDLTDKGYKINIANILHKFLKKTKDNNLQQHFVEMVKKDEGFVTHHRRLLSIEGNKEKSSDQFADEHVEYYEDLEYSHQQWLERYGNWEPKLGSSETSFFPWERQSIFQKEAKSFNNYASQRKTGRHLLDTFADSLLHVHRLYNKKFGYSGRKVPAHMPHMIDVDIMEELQQSFLEEFDKTSSHKLRSSDDMQFAFSYNYFVIGKTTTLNTTLLFTELDTDQSGDLSKRELRTLAARIYPLPLKLSNIKDLERTLLNCSLNDMNGVIPVNSGVFVINEALLSSCTAVTKLLNESKGMKKKFKYETVNDDEVSFKMISNNASKVLKQLDNIRASKKKFICLNDNIDHSQNSTLVRALLVDFYESLFPIPSQFELPTNLRNTFLYVEDLNRWQEEQSKRRKQNCKYIGLIFMILLMLIYRHKILRFVLYPFRRRFTILTSHTRLITL